MTFGKQCSWEKGAGLSQGLQQVDEPPSRAQRYGVGPPCSLARGGTGSGSWVSGHSTHYCSLALKGGPSAWLTKCETLVLDIQKVGGLLMELGKHCLYPVAWKEQGLEEMWPEWGWVAFL